MLVQCTKCNTIFSIESIRDFRNGCPRCGYKLFKLVDEEKKPLLNVKIIEKGVFSINFGEPENRVIIIQSGNRYKILYLNSPAKR
ncbi:MAG: OapC/ArvC family zinc-ribbon domain-containing protein [Candidatus Njordarchaeales archaeon]